MKKSSDVYLLLVEVGRKAGDGLPDGCDGAAVICYAAGESEEQAVNDAVRLLKEADMAPLEVSCHSSRSERLEMGEDIPREDLALMRQAQDDHAVIVVQIEPLYDEDEIEDLEAYD